MPQLQPFGGEPERRPADFDYEVRRAGVLSSSEELWVGKRLILTKKPNMNWSVSNASWPANSAWTDLSIVHSEHVEVTQFHGKISSSIQRDCDIHLPERDRTLVKVYFENEADRVKLSGAIYPMRMCNFGAGRAIYDEKDQLLLTTHPAWRDSETRRGMVEGYVVHAQCTDELRELAAIVAALIAGTRPLAGYGSD